MQALGLIGGTGLAEIEHFVVERSFECETEYGPLSSPILEGFFEGSEQRYCFLSRHGRPHALAPHLINYRANVAALASMDVSGIIAVNAVGGISAAMTTASLCVPDQIIDYTWGRASTYYDGELNELRHIDFTEPYDQTLRERLLGAATAQGIALHDGGTYACTQGPRLESAAEIRRLERDACDVVGMTGMPEAALARELDLPYCSLAVVVNRAAGKSAETITLADIQRVLEQSLGTVSQLLRAL